MTAVKPEIPKDIQGWCDYSDYLWRIANQLHDGAIIVELGPWLGLGTIFMATSLDVLNKPNCMIHAIDTWKGNPSEQPMFDYIIAGSPVNPKTRFERSLVAYGVAQMVHPMEFDSVIAAKYFELGSVDFIFFDTEHTEERLSAELVAWLPKMKPGSLFGGHDIAVPGVRAAVTKHVKNWKEVGPCWEAKND